MFPNDRFPPTYDLFTLADLASLEDAIMKRFDGEQIGRILFYSGWNWDDNIEPGAFNRRVDLLVRHLDQVGQLHWLVDLIDRERVNHPIFSVLRDRATPPLLARTGAVPAAVAQPKPVVAPPGPNDETMPAPGESSDPWKMVLLDTDQPFLDRAAFREDCRLVGMARSKTILSVTGGPDTGKSYTSRYLAGVGKFLSADDCAFVTREIHLDRLNGIVEAGASADIDGLRLAQRVSLAITDEPLPGYIAGTVGSEQDNMWAADAALWIMSAPKDKPLRWVVFDGFETTVLSPSAQALINSLLGQVATDGKIRIALLGYPGNLSWCTAALRHVVLEMDEFSDPVKVTNHVINYLLEVRRAAEQRKRPPFTAEQLDADVRDVLRGVDPVAPDLHVLEASLTTIAERVLVGA